MGNNVNGFLEILTAGGAWNELLCQLAARRSDADLLKVGSSTLSREYCLAGGTGLALQMKHRRSNDLDFLLIDHNETVNAPSVISTLEKLSPIPLPCEFAGINSTGSDFIRDQTYLSGISVSADQPPVKGDKLALVFKRNLAGLTIRNSADESHPSVEEQLSVIISIFIFYSLSRWLILPI